MIKNYNYPCVALTLSAIALFMPSFDLDVYSQGPTAPSNLTIMSEGNDFPLAPLMEAILPTESQDVGNAAGFFSGTGEVMADGSSSYTIPISVPIGRNKVQPELSLKYNSYTGNGLLGVGWSLTGVSQISRCIKSFHQDGIASEIQFVDGDDGDRFCLNGQRLVIVGKSNSPTPTGGADTEYRLEHDIHAKVIAYSQDSQGPAYFKVFLGDGRVLTFGRNSKSVIEGPRIHITDKSGMQEGPSDPIFGKRFSADYSQYVRYSWALSRIEDRSGNFSDFHYSLDLHNNLGLEQYLDYIEYTGSTVDPNIGPTRFITFSYEPRSDLLEKYICGLRMTTSKRLNRVQVRWGEKKSSSQPLLTYELRYRNDSTSKRSRLVEVSKCADVCLPPVRFEWSIGATGFSEIDTRKTIETRLSPSVAVADVDGDGRDEVYSSGDIGVHFSDAPDTVPMRISEPRYVDLNGDGRHDKISLKPVPRPSGSPGTSWTPMVKNSIHFSTTAGWVELEDDDEQFARGQRPAYALDLNGDGLPELMKNTRISGTENYQWSTRWNLGGNFGPYVGTGISAPLGPTLASGFKTTKTLIVDLNGSGRSSLLDESAAIGLVNGKITYESTNWAPFDKLVQRRSGAQPLNFLDALFIDFNGDGLKDWLLVGDTLETTMIAVNTGHGFDLPRSINVPAPFNGVSFYSPSGQGGFDRGIRVGDFNSDGREDLLLMNGYKSSIGKMLLLLESTASGFMPILLPFMPMAENSVDGWRQSQILDYNGDGLLDFAQVVDGTIHIYVRDGMRPDLITRIEDSAGVLEAFSYSPITDSQVYSSRTTCPVFQICAKSKLWVVSAHVFDSGGQYFDVNIPKSVQDDAANIFASAVFHRNAAPSPTPNTWKNFRDRRTGLTVNFPSSWDVSDTTDGVILRKNDVSLIIGYGQADGPAQWVFKNLPYGDMENPSPYNVHDAVMQKQSLSLNGKVKTIFFYSPPLKRPLGSSRTGLQAIYGRLNGSSDPGPRTINYRYKDGRFDRGRGWLGFAERTSFDLWTGIQTTTHFDTSTRKGTAYPCLGFVDLERTDFPIDADHYRRKETTAQCSVVTFQHKDVHFSYAGVTRSTQWEGSNQHTLQLVSVERSTQTKDEFGNTTFHARQVYSVKDGKVLGRSHQRTVHTEYDLFPETWLIGQRKRVEITDMLPSGRSVTRAVRYEYQPSTGLLWKIFREPDSAKSDLYLETTLERDPYGNIISIEASGSGQVRNDIYAYDKHALFVSSHTNAVGHIEKFIHHSGLGVVIAYRNINGLDTKFQYDGFGRVRNIYRSGMADETRSYALDNAGHRVIVVAEPTVGTERKTTFDRLGRSIGKQWKGFAGRPIKVDIVYDSLGRLSSLSYPHFIGSIPSIRRYEYDILDRTRHVLNPDGSGKNFDYDGLRVTSIDELGHRSFFVTDELGRVTIAGEADRSGHEYSLRYEYGPFATLEGIEGPNGHRINQAFDTLGRPIKVSDPDLGTRTYALNAFGEFQEQRDGKDVKSTYKHDPVGRILQVDTPEGKTIYNWDKSANGIGRLAETTSSDGILVSYAYDSHARLKEQTWNINQEMYSFEYTYNKFGDVETVTYPAVRDSRRLKVQYAYDSAGHVYAIDNPQTHQRYWEIKDQNVYGQPTQQSSQSGMLVNESYDSRGLPKSLDIQSEGQFSQLLKYAYDLKGRLKSIEDFPPFGDFASSVREGFEYDEFDRLIKWDFIKVPSNLTFTVDYDYHINGNIRSRTISGTSNYNYVYTYGEEAGPHAVTRIDSAGVSAVYGYDLNGNQTKGPDRTIEYTSFNQPRRVSGSQEILFKYDAMGNRVLRQNANGAITTFVGGLYEKRVNPNETTHVHYMQINGRTIGMINTTEVNGSPLRDENLFLILDHLGSPIIVADIDGKIKGQQRFSPFGQRRLPDDSEFLIAPPNELGMGFTGHSHDDEIGLVDMHARVYDPQIGRFLSPDPLISDSTSIQSYNRYSYVANNPTNYTDPTGLQETSPSGSGDVTLRSDLPTSGVDIVPTGSGFTPHTTHIGGDGSSSIPYSCCGPSPSPVPGSGGDDSGTRISSENYAAASLSAPPTTALQSPRSSERTLLDAAVHSITGFAVGAFHNMLVQGGSAGVFLGIEDQEEYELNLLRHKLSTLEFDQDTVARGEGFNEAISTPGKSGSRPRPGIIELEARISMPMLRRAARIGQEAHRQILKYKFSKWIHEQTLELIPGVIVRKDAIRLVKDGAEVLIIKPDTLSGRAAAEARASLMEKAGYKPKIEYYNPSDPAFLPTSPTYIGPGFP